MTDFVALSDKFIVAYNAKDFDTLRSMLADDLDFAHFNRNFAYDTPEPLIEIMNAFAANLLPDRRFETPERVTASGNVVIRESWYTGTATQDIPGFADKGPMRMKLCSVLRFNDDGIIVEWKDYG